MNPRTLGEPCRNGGTHTRSREANFSCRDPSMCSTVGRQELRGPVASKVCRRNTVLCESRTSDAANFNPVKYLRL